MKNLIIIPARKNSKRVKNKNLVKVLKKPLIFWTIKYAKKFNKKNYDVVVSSDCSKIKKICIIPHCNQFKSYVIQYFKKNVIY